MLLEVICCLVQCSGQILGNWLRGSNGIHLVEARNPNVVKEHYLMKCSFLMPNFVSGHFLKGCKTIHLLEAQKLIVLMENSFWKPGFFTKVWDLTVGLKV